LYISRIIKKVSNELAESSLNIEERIKQIAEGNNDLSSRTQTQASSLEQTSATLEQLSSSSKEITSNSETANDLSSSSVKTSQEGKASFDKTTQAMHEISESSKKILEIVGLVETIAFQTNILAINAAIEAAKAGEHGRGFAVVAIEVRALAQRASAATKDIKTLIDVSVAKTLAGEVLVKENSGKLLEIADSVKKVADIMSEILNASREQYTAVSQINKVIATLDEATQQNASLVEQVSSTSESIVGQVATMSELINSSFIRN